MIADVKRAYVPAVEWKRNALQQLSIANLQALNNINGQGQYPDLVRVTLDPTLIHRKVWCWFWSVSATWAASVSLVGRLKGNIEFEHKIVNWSTGSLNDKYVWNFWLKTTSVGAAGEELTVVIATSTTYSAAPFRLNTGIDELFLRVDSLSGAAAAFDAAIIVQSQRGI